MACVGILALQGGYAAHAAVLRQLGHEVRELRNPSDFVGLDGAVLPGGESTTQLKLITRNDLRAPLQALVDGGKPILATCAGVILASRKVTHPEQPSFGWLNIVTERNAYGRQLDSFEATSDGGLPLVFIRAPRIREVGDGVEVLDSLDGEPILVRQGSVFGATFHPELTDSTTLHQRVFG